MLILPTRLGARFLMLMAVLVLVYFVTAYSNLYFLLLCLLGTVLGVGALSARMGLAGVRAELGTPRPAPVGTPALVPLRVTAAPRRGAAAVRFRILCAGRTGSVTIPHLHAGSDERCGIEGLPRGVHPISAATVSSAAPLGLFRARMSLGALPPLVVPPRPLDLSDAANADAPAWTLAEAARGATQPASLREHRPGDDARRIHWKASSRGRGIVVREMEVEADRGIEVVLDARCGPDAAARARFEEVLGVIAGLGTLARERKEPLTLMTQRSRRTYGENFAPTDELMSWLAAAQPLTVDDEAPPAASPGTLVLRCGAPRKSAP